jgi:hypothetical protein
MTVCEKIQYNSKQDALDAVTGMQKAKRGIRVSKDQPVTAYRCNECGKWHVASRANGRRKKQKGHFHTNTVTIRTKKGGKSGYSSLRIRNFRR